VPPHDAIVVGLGGIGSAALHALAKRGVKVLGIDAFGIAHDRGSSHGATRILRKAYFEHPDYIPLLHQAYRDWADLEEAVDRKLVYRTGLLMIGLADRSLIRGVKLAARKHQLDIDHISLEGVRARFPGVHPAGDMDALYERDAGYLAVEECVRAHVDQAVAHGAEIKLDGLVREWNADATGVEVITDEGRYVADRLVICGGAWSGSLLAGIGLPLEVRRKVVMWFEPRSKHHTVEAGCPVFCFDTAEGFFYGFPAIDERGMKLGEHSGGAVVDDPDRLDRGLHADDLLRVQSFIENHVPDLPATPLDHSVCMYTMTPDEHFIVDIHPEQTNVVFAAGFSGHGFKFAPVMGTILADLALTGKTDQPMDFLRASRIGGTLTDR